MSFEDDEDEARPFNVRSVNVIKIKQPIDCEILISECDRAIADIKEQIQGGYGDKSWLAEAVLALRAIEHKREMGQKKLDFLSVKGKVAPVEDNFKSRFMKKAAELLPSSTYGQIYEAARHSAVQDGVAALAEKP